MTPRGLDSGLCITISDPCQRKPTWTKAKRSAVAGLIREHLRTTRNHLSPSLPHLKSAFVKLAPADPAPATPKLTLRPIGLLPRR